MKTKILYVTLTLTLALGCAKKEEETLALKTEPPKIALSSTEAKAVVESAIRLEINKPEGELTKADFERVTVLFLINTQLTNANA